MKILLKLNDFSLKKTREYLAIIIGVFGSLFHIYNLGFSQMNMWSYRLIHVGMATAIIFLLKPIFKKEKLQMIDFIINLLLIGILIFVNAYIMINRARLEMFMSFAAKPLDVAVCTVGVLLVLEMTRRINGLAMPILASIFLIYGFFGQYLRGIASHAGYSINRISTFLYSCDGIFGTSIAVSATFVILFIIFGSVMEGTGGGTLFINGAISAFGGVRGGPAKAAVVSSALMGMISGSSAANVVTTGAFTIPLMKKIGYETNFAGSVEAVASTGGQIMPPIMGAGAFLMAEALGVPYIEVAKAAIIPALLYFFAVFVNVDIEAVKRNLRGLKKDELPDMKIVLKEYGLLVIPIFILIYLLVIERTSPIKAGLYGIYSSFIIALLNKPTRYSFKKFIMILYDGMKSALSVIAACACAGIIIGILTLTGLGSKMVTLIIALSGGKVPVALFLVMIVSIILGMGLPTTAAYIVCSSVVVPALVKMGVPAFSAHFFVFFFACLSAVTPPVAIASYAAAGISGGNVNKTGWCAFRIALAVFLVPYMCVYNGSLFMFGSIGQIIKTVITATIGIFMFVSGVSGYFMHKTNTVIRILLIASSILLLDGKLITDIIGIVSLAICFILQKYVFINKEINKCTELT